MAEAKIDSDSVGVKLADVCEPPMHTAHGKGDGDGVAEAAPVWRSPWRKFSTRLLETCTFILTKVEESSFDFTEEGEDATESNDREMERLENIFQHYRNPRISHMRKFEHYHRLLVKEMTNISVDPLHNVYLACERQPYLSCARKDFLQLFNDYKRSKKVLKYNQATNKDLVVPLYRSIGGLPFTFGPLQSMFGGHKRMVNSVAVSADDTFLVSGGEDTTLRVWHSTSGNCELVLEDHSDEVNCVAISKDMKVLLSGSKDKSVKIWERKTGKVIMTLFDHRQSVTCLAVSPTGPFFVSGSKDCTAVVWVLNPGGKGSTGDRMYIIPHQYPVHSVCFSFEGNVIFTGSGREPVKEEENNMEFLTSGEIGVFAADRREGEALLPPFSYFGGPVVSIAVSRAKNDGMGQKVAAASTADIYFIVLDMDTRETHRFQGHDSVVTSVDITEDGASVVSGSWDNSVRFWETKTCTCLKVLLGHSSNINAVTLSGGGQKCFSAGEDEQIGVWDLMAVKELLSSDVLSDSINSVCMSADGSTVAALIGLKQVYLWSVTTGKHIYTIKSEHGVSWQGLSPSGDYVCLGLDIKEVHVWSSSVSGSGMGLFGDPSKVVVTQG